MSIGSADEWPSVVMDAGRAWLAARAFQGVAHSVLESRVVVHRHGGRVRVIAGRAAVTLVSVMSPQIAPGRDKTMMESEIPVPSGSWVFVYVMSVEPHDARVSAPYMGFTDMGNVPHDGLNARVFHATA